MKREYWKSAMDKLHLTPSQLRSSYNLVLHMDSCALDYPTIYEQCKRNNPARNETIQEAIQLNEKGFEAWKPDVRIHSEATWEAKLETLFKAVDAWLIKLYNK